MVQVPVHGPISTPHVGSAPQQRPSTGVAQVAQAGGKGLIDLGDSLQKSEDTSNAAEALSNIQREVTDLEFNLRSGDGKNAGEIYDQETTRIFQKHSTGLTKDALAILSPRFNTYSQSTRLRVRNYARIKTIERGKASVVNIFENRRDKLMELLADGREEEAVLLMNDARVHMENAKSSGFFKADEGNKFFREYRDEVVEGALLNGARRPIKDADLYTVIRQEFSKGDFSRKPHLQKLYNSMDAIEQQKMRETLGKEAFRIQRQDNIMEDRARKAAERAEKEQNDLFRLHVVQQPDAETARTFIQSQINTNGITAESIAWTQNYMETFGNRTIQSVFRSQVEQVVDGRISNMSQIDTKNLNRTDYVFLAQMVQDKADRKSFFTSQAYKVADDLLDNEPLLIPKASIINITKNIEKNKNFVRQAVVRKRLIHATIDAQRRGNLPAKPFSPKGGEYNVIAQAEREVERMKRDVARIEQAETTHDAAKTLLQKITAFVQATGTQAKAKALNLLPEEHRGKTEAQFKALKKELTDNMIFQRAVLRDFYEMGYTHIEFGS